MQARHLAPIGLGVMGLGIIALGALPGTAYAAKDKVKDTDKTSADHKVWWCHATSSKKNPWVLIEIDTHGDGENPNSRAHDISHHPNDKPAVWSDELGDWTCEEEEPASCVLEPPELIFKECFWNEDLEGYICSSFPVPDINPGMVYLATHTSDYYPLGPMYTVTYETTSPPDGDLEGRVSITNVTEVPGPTNLGPVSAASNDLGGGMYEDVLVGAGGFSDAGMECGVSFDNDGLINAVWCTSEEIDPDTGTPETVEAAINCESLKINAALYAPGEEVAACESEIIVVVGVGCS